MASWIGARGADGLFGVGGALTQALARRPVGLVTDAFGHLGQLADAYARWQAWQRGEFRLGEPPADADAPTPRPVPLPDGPAESAANRIGLWAPAAYGGALLATVQLPGISHFFGCRPLWPHLFLIALASATTATIAATINQR